jgi:hypothetical protein
MSPPCLSETPSRAIDGPGNRHADTRLTERHYAHLAPSYVGDTVRAAFGDVKLAPASNVVPIAASTPAQPLVDDDAAAHLIDHTVLGVVG